MPKLIAALAVAWTLILSGIFVQLWQINRHLSWLAAPIVALSDMARVAAHETATETRDQRIERRARELRESNEETAEIWKRLLTPPAPASRATLQQSPQSPPSNDRRR